MPSAKCRPFCLGLNEQTHGVWCHVIIVLIIQIFKMKTQTELLWLKQLRSGLELRIPSLAVPWWRHDMETFSTLLALCERNPSVTGRFPRKGPMARSFHVSLMFAWACGLVKRGVPGDLRRHDAHPYVTTMIICVKAYLRARYFSCFSTLNLEDIRIRVK